MYSSQCPLLVVKGDVLLNENAKPEIVCFKAIKQYRSLIVKRLSFIDNGVSNEENIQARYKITTTLIFFMSEKNPQNNIRTPLFTCNTICFHYIMSNQWRLSAGKMNKIG